MQTATEQIRRYQWSQMGRTITADQEASREQYATQNSQSGADSEVDSQTAYSVNNILGLESLTQLKLLLNPKTMINKYLVILNSALQDPELNGSGLLQWTLSYDAQGPGLVQMPADMKHIVGVRYACPFRMLQGSPSNTYANVPFPGSSWWAQRYNTKSLMTIAIEEFRAQSFIGPPYPTKGSSTVGAQVSPITNVECRRFHFVARQENVGEIGFVYEIPVYEADVSQFGQGFYWFQHPYIPPSTLTLSFGAPFLPCKLYGTIEKGAAIINLSGTLTIWFDQFTYMLNEPVYISGFTTTDPVADAALINAVNTQLHTDISIDQQMFPYPNNITVQTGFVFNNIDLSAVTLPANLQCVVRSTRSVMYTIGLEFYYTSF